LAASPAWDKVRGFWTLVSAMAVSHASILKTAMLMYGVAGASLGLQYGGAICPVFCVYQLGWFLWLLLPVAAFVTGTVLMLWYAWRRCWVP
jgi:hypothetical protein